MYLCLCHGISDKKIRQLIKQKDQVTIRHIQSLTKAGTNCGACLCEIKQLIENACSEPAKDDSESLKTEK